MKVKKYATNHFFILIVALICCMLWGSAFPVLKLLYKAIQVPTYGLYEQILLAGLRFFIASLLIFMVLLFKINIFRGISKKNWGILILLGIIQTSLQYFFFYIGISKTSGIKAAVLSSSGPLFIIFLAHFIYHDDKLYFRKFIGLTLGFIGLIFVNWGKGSFGFEFSILGEGFLLLAGLMNALGTFISKKVTKEIHPFLITAWQMLFGSLLLFLLVGTSFFYKDINIVWNGQGMGLLVYSGFLSAVAFSSWNFLLKYNKAGEISIYQFMIPIWGAFLSLLLIPGEKLNFQIFGGLILVSLGIFVVYYKKQSKGRSL